MSSINQTDNLQTGALSTLRNFNHIAHLDMLANSTGGSIENLGNPDIQRIDTSCFHSNVDFKEKICHTLTAKSSEKASTDMNEILPAVDLSLLHFSAEAKVNFVMGNCKTLREIESWQEYLEEFPEEILSRSLSSTCGPFSDGSISGEKFEGNENVYRLDHGETFIYDPLGENWNTNGTAEYSPEIDGPFLGESIRPEIFLVADFSETEMDCVDWSELMDVQVLNEQKLKRRERKLRRKANSGANTWRRRSSRAAAGSCRRKMDKYNFKAGSYSDFGRR